jgi:hypothetical protein
MDYLTVGERFAHFLCSKPLPQLLSYIEHVLGRRLAMTAFTIVHLSYARPLGAPFAVITSYPVAGQFAFQDSPSSHSKVFLNPLIIVLH